MSELAPNFEIVEFVRQFRFSFGDIAQLVEQMTFNHWVQGSSPCVPTKKTRGYPRDFCLFGICMTRQFGAPQQLIKMHRRQCV